LFHPVKFNGDKIKCGSFLLPVPVMRAVLATLHDGGMQQPVISF